jgi:hypothetical protein
MTTILQSEHNSCASAISNSNNVATISYPAVATLEEK